MSTRAALPIISPSTGEFGMPAVAVASALNSGCFGGLVDGQGVGDVDASVRQRIVDLSVAGDGLAPDHVDGDLPAGALLDVLLEVVAVRCGHGVR